MADEDQPNPGPDSNSVPEADPELKAFSSVPALHTNRFYVWAASDIVRVGFLEIALPDKASYPRTAIVLSPANALALGELLVRLTKPIVHPVETATKGPEKNDG